MAKRSQTIEFRHLHYFVAAAEHGSFRKAGIALGLSQSAVSRCIADLEDQIGASLFHRHTWGVSLTYAGQRFLLQSRKAIRIIGEGTHAAASAARSEEGHVRIGIYSSIASGFLLDLLRHYSERYARVHIEMVDGNPVEHVAAIRQLGLDVAFLAGTRDWLGCERMHLWSEGVYVALPTTHALANQKTLEWSDLADETFIVSEAAPGEEIYDYLVQGLADLGRHPIIQVHGIGRDNLVSLVALGRGLTVFSEAMTAASFPGVVYRPLAKELLPFCAFWSQSNDNPAFRRLLSLAKVLSKNRKSLR